MRFFIDTEFIERGPAFPIELISIGIVAENGMTLYEVSAAFDPEHASDWVHQNVFPFVGQQRPLPLSAIAAAIKEFVSTAGGSEKPQFWGYYADYDWVVFCQIFGAMIDLPKGWPMYCRDLKQWCDFLGNPKLPTQDATEHNALNDAKWNKVAWEFLDARVCEVVNPRT